MLWKVILVLLIGFLAWAYQAFCPPQPKICGSPGGPAIEAPRIKLRDGRYLAYKEHGVPKATANYKIILVHGFGESRHEARLSTSELVEKLGIHFVSFDRPGYGQSDPDPKRTIESTALDIEELGEQLELGPKFYIIGFSMGGQVVWGCLKYISHRLAGAALIAPVINYWWSGFPENLAKEAYKQQYLQDQWTLRVAHYAPWLIYWWNTQKWFPASSVQAGRANYTAPDLQVLSHQTMRLGSREYATQQGVHESLHRDLMVGFGHWEFDPMNIENPFVESELGSVHLWHGVEDGLVPVMLQRYIAEKLPWIHYHELPNAGHLFAHVDTSVKDAILKTLLNGDNNMALNKFDYSKEVGRNVTIALGSLCPPLPRLCGSPGGPAIEAPRIKLRDGRHLAYKEHGVPKETANYKIILVHGFGLSYGQSDPDPKRTIKSTALDIEELGDKLELGSKFYVIGFSMGGQAVWGCLKYIPNRLAGAVLIAPVINYWWPGFPAKLAKEAYNQQFPQDQWALRVAHHAPWLVYWLNTQKWFPASSVAAGRPNFTLPDLQILSHPSAKRPGNMEYATQQGIYESLHRDMMIGFGKWDFDPMNLDNSTLEGSVHLWQGIEDGLVPVTLQRYIAKKLPWIHYHELPNAGHLFAYADSAKYAILTALLTGQK
ncbi:hypothetical protein ACJIZ3_022790 [Penstemon smallii]|uniref:AB hydrolase-1 domain-containing protein n=1 Tax=Penstemon smallii TaxID=265156 RepID=A0ABD3TMB0_9LAMI